MININELRIGNWIHSNQTLLHPNLQVKPALIHITSISTTKLAAIQHNLEYRVEPFEDDVMVQKTPEFIPEELEPISLTEEWMQNFGFQKTETGDWLSEEKNNQQIKIPASFNFNTSPSATVNISTVHQLQNLYFALTGQELEMKE